MYLKKKILWDLLDTKTPAIGKRLTTGSWPWGESSGAASWFVSCSRLLGFVCSALSKAEC